MARWGPRAQHLRAIDFLHAMEEGDTVGRVPQVEALLVDKVGRVFVLEVPL